MPRETGLSWWISQLFVCPQHQQGRQIMRSAVCLTGFVVSFLLTGCLKALLHIKGSPIQSCSCATGLWDPSETFWGLQQHPEHPEAQVVPLLRVS